MTRVFAGIVLTYVFLSCEMVKAQAFYGNVSTSGDLHVGSIWDLGPNYLFSDDPITGSASVNAPLVESRSGTFTGGIIGAPGSGTAEVAMNARVDLFPSPVPGEGPYWRIGADGNASGWCSAPTNDSAAIGEGHCSAVVTVQDAFSAAANNPVLPNDVVEVGFLAKFYGQVYIDGNVSHSQGIAQAQVDAYSGGGVINLGPAGVGSSGFDSFLALGGGWYTATFHTDLPIVSGSASYSAAITCTADASNGGSATIAAQCQLTSIGLPIKGKYVTPESLGTALSFQSGTASPNLAPTIAPTQWAGASGASWSGSDNWTAGQPNVDQATAELDSSTNSDVVVNLDAPQTVGTLLFGSGTAGAGYTIAGAGGNSLTFSNTNNDSFPALISVADGTHSIDAPVILASNLVLTSASSTPFTLSFGTASSITDNGDNFSLTMIASNGTLILSGSDNYTGGTNVGAGIVEMTNADALPAGSSLTIGANASSLFGAALQATPMASDVQAVPEPGTLALLGAGLTVGFAAWRRRQHGRRTFCLSQPASEYAAGSELNVSTTSPPT
jgi:autotransporter-associated beta strand protein